MTSPPRPLRWDIFCRVVDNFGDVGVCWRLATQLAQTGDAVRLVADDASALVWMVPERARTAPGVQVLAWPGPGETMNALVDAADIVIEAFGCDPPEAYVQAMRERQALPEDGAHGSHPSQRSHPSHTSHMAQAAPAALRPPVWINLEYLSAEDYVERSHGLASPRADGLRKWFFYPGFSARTGGLLREPGLLAQRAAFDAERWLAALGRRLGFEPRPGERVVSLFCYDNPALAALLASLSEQPTLLLLTPGPAQQQVRSLGRLPGHLRTVALPWLSQAEYDQLLWACDLNCVRGEDSLVRALWASKPWLWQAYPQHDGAHAAKVQALIVRLAWPAEVAAAWRAWNGLAPWAAALPALGPWQKAAEAAQADLASQPDLVAQLRHFALRC